MTLIRLLTATTLAATCSWGFAQSTVSPAKKELVLKVLALQQTDVEGFARNLAAQSIAPIAQQATAVLQSRVPPEQRDAMHRDIQAEFKKYGDEVVPILRDRAIKLAPSTVGAVLEEKMSEDELKQVVAMLEAPFYRKYQQIGPDMQKSLLEKLVADSRPVVEPKLKALQETIAKRLGLEAPSAAKKPAAASAPKAGASAAKK